MIFEGVQLLLVGMTTVFAFLTLLVGLMVGSAGFFEAFEHRFAEAPPATPAVQAGAGNEEEIAVVLAAVEAHRRR